MKFRIAIGVACLLSFGVSQTYAQETLQEAWAGEPLVKWEFKAEEAIEASPAIGKHAIYVADAMGTVYAIDRDSGKEIWRRNFETGFSVSPTVYPSGPWKISSKDSSPPSKETHLFIGDYDGNFYSLDVSNGEVRWKVMTEGSISGAAAIYKRSVLASSQDGSLYCFAISDGSMRWQYETDDQIRCSPAIAGNRTFLGGCDGRLHIVDLESGKAAGEPLPLDGPTGSTPAIFKERAYLPIMDGVLYAIDWHKAKHVWNYQDPERPQEYRNSAAVNRSIVVISSARRQVDAISTQTGKRVWRHTLRRRAEATPVLYAGHVWIAATDGRLIRLAIENGESSWEYEVRGSFLAGPVFVEQQMWIADDRGVLRCFETKPSQSRVEKPSTDRGIDPLQ